MRDPYDLGAELFRWQFAVAVVGAVLSVNPFDQPDVQRSKEETDAVLEEYASRAKPCQTWSQKGPWIGLLAESGSRRLPLDSGIRPADPGHGQADSGS